MPDASSYDFSGLDPRSRLALATMAVKEGGDSPQDMQAVLTVAANRARMSGQSIEDVLNTSGAFTSLGPLGSPSTPAGRRSLDQALYLIDHPNPDVQVGSNVDYFYNPTLQAQKHAEDPQHYPASPSFLSQAGMQPAGGYGHQLFYAGPYKGGKQMAPGPTASPAVNSAISAQQLPQVPGLQEALTTAAQREAQLTPQVEAALDQKGELLQQEFDAAQDYRKSVQGISDRFQASNQKIIDAIPDEQKMRQEELAKVSDQPNDPTRIFGQLLPMLAIFGGAFTKAGVTGSLNAAAAAMGAAKTNDQEALKRAHSQFQDQLQEVQEKASMLHEQMADALAASNGNWNTYLASMNLLAAKYDIPAAKLAAEQGSVKDLLGIQDGLFKTSMQIQDQAIKMADLDIKQRAEALKEKTAGQSEFDPNTDEYFATVGIAGNPPGSPKITGNLGMGSNPERAKIANDMAGISMKRWKTDDPKTAAALDVANGANLHADVQALNKANTNIMQVKGYINGAEGLAKLVEDKIGPGAGPTGARLLNRYINAARNNLWVDKDLVELRTNLEDLRVESAKIMSGATGSVRAPSDKAAETLEGLISSNQPAADIEGALSAMRGGWKARLDGYDQEIESKRNDILSRASANAAPGTQTDDDGNVAGGSGAGGAKTAPQGLKTENDRQLWTSREQKFIQAKRDGSLHKEYTPSAIREQFRAWFPDATDAAIDRAVDTIEATK